MQAIADEIVGGFNEYLNAQRQRDGTARLSLVQFDDADPFEILIDAADLATASGLDRAAYQPRGMTPLMDAVGRMIGRIDNQVAARPKADDEEDQIVVVVTDGMENASVEHTRDSVFKMVENRRKQGWVFVFLGADQDAYAEGTAMGISGPNAAPWVKTKAGTQKMWRDLEYSTTAHRSKAKMARYADADTFYEENPDQD
jgi:Mg-chelatase subunit ChlD